MTDAVRQVMTPDCTCVGEKDSVATAARKLAELGVGSMPICGDDDRLKGMITDRDIVVKVLADGRDPESTTVGQLADGKPVTIGADESIDQALQAMAEHKIRRLPVLEDRELVGMVSQADLARTAPEDKVGATVGAISAAA